MKAVAGTGATGATAADGSFCRGRVFLDVRERMRPLLLKYLGRRAATAQLQLQVASLITEFIWQNRQHDHHGQGQERQSRQLGAAPAVRTAGRTRAGADAGGWWRRCRCCCSVARAQACAGLRAPLSRGLGFLFW